MRHFKKHSVLKGLIQGEELLLSNTDFKGFEQNLDFNELVITKKNRNIGFVGHNDALPFEINHQVGGVDFHGYKSSYETLGLRLFQLLFSSESYMHLNLSREQSQIRHLFLHLDRTAAYDYNLKTKPLVAEHYTYFREAVEKFPLSGTGFSERCLREEDSPVFLWGWSESNLSYQENRQELADQLIISLTIDALGALATVFLDMAAAENELDEICLEHPSLGFGGTGINSLEARFWLPNSFGFYCESLDDLKV